MSLSLIQGYSKLIYKAPRKRLGVNHQELMYFSFLTEVWWSTESVVVVFRTRGINSLVVLLKMQPGGVTLHKESPLKKK